MPVTAILIQLPVQALRQRLLGLSVVIRVICPFLLTIPPQLLQLLLVFLAKAQLYLISLPLLITHTHRGDIQVMLLTLSALFFSQLTGQLNCFFLQIVECRLFLKLLLFYIQQRQCLNQFIFTGQHTLFICRQFFPVQIADALLQSQKLFMRFCHLFSGNAC